MWNNQYINLFIKTCQGVCFFATEVFIVKCKLREQQVNKLVVMIRWHLVHGETCTLLDSDTTR
ncbi:hypothetical protein HanXRQr2_Chr09g0386621 [Helianthus annuus]|uniref:Uncharacterized protein n=1 Tax=Helianthus annuus TaxID=4232 RepID=A0A9K3N857_HELAN|nr:hypothetical protein HanXRQr2_Chr09g0386621 [Helianthus annuus]KAJ0893000.1 hypothetical protein HanPSC8_Chr09g0372601 [Helianthus annuus]